MTVEMEAYATHLLKVPRDQWRKSARQVCLVAPVPVEPVIEGAPVGDDDAYVMNADDLTRPTEGLHVVGNVIDNVQTYANTNANMKEAIAKRIEPAMERRKRGLNNLDRKVGHAYRRFGTYLTRELIHKHADELFSLDNMVSRKWSPGRTSKAMSDLAEVYDFDVLSKDYTGFIKREASDIRKGKPRIIQNLGDVRQLASLAVIAVMEHAVFDIMQHHSIKYQPKETRLREWTVDAEERVVNGVYIEGDGTCFDAHVHTHILQHEEELMLIVLGHLQGYAFEVPLEWASKEIAANPRDYKLSCKEVGFGREVRRYCKKLRAQRRSGERWTSLCNYLVNLTHWTAVLAHNVTGTMDSIIAGSPTYKRVQNDEDRHFEFIFEGDDSLVRLPRDGLTVDEIQNIEEGWGLLGFDFKMQSSVNGPKILEFCGMHAYTAGDTIADHRDPVIGDAPLWWPDIKRTLKGCNYLKSRPVGCPHYAASTMLKARSTATRGLGPVHTYISTLAEYHTRQMTVTSQLDAGVARESTFMCIEKDDEMSDEYHTQCFRQYVACSAMGLDRAPQIDQVLENALTSGVATVVSDPTREAISAWLQ
jgi:hypothetical protein